MRKYYRLLENIASKLDITQGVEENIEEYKLRIIYSAIGRVTLASLYDEVTELNSVSITHIKQRILHLQKAYIDLYKEILNETQYLTDDKLNDYIYQIYLNAGYYYHFDKNVMPCGYTEVNYNSIKLRRGKYLHQNLAMSGLGIYTIDNRYSGASIEEVMNMFKIPTETYSQYVLKLIKKAKWEEMKTDYRDIEFLNTTGEFRKGYWKATPNAHQSISLMRRKILLGKEEYYLYKHEGKTKFIYHLPKWRVTNKEYRRIALGLLQINNTLPMVQANKYGSIVKLKLGYLVPEFETNFLKLYSWPVDIKNEFEYTFATEIFEIFKGIMNRQGIDVIVKEEK